MPLESPMPLLLPLVLEAEVVEVAPGSGSGSVVAASVVLGSWPLSDGSEVSTGGAGGRPQPIAAVRTRAAARRDDRDGRNEARPSMWVL